MLSQCELVTNLPALVLVIVVVALFGRSIYKSDYRKSTKIFHVVLLIILSVTGLIFLIIFGWFLCSQGVFPSLAYSTGIGLAVYSSSSQVITLRSG